MIFAIVLVVLLLAAAVAECRHRQIVRRRIHEMPATLEGGGSHLSRAVPPPAPGPGPKAPPVPPSHRPVS